MRRFEGRDSLTNDDVREALELARWCEAEADKDVRLMRATHPARREDECDSQRGLKLRRIADYLRALSVPRTPSEATKALRSLADFDRDIREVAASDDGGEREYGEKRLHEAYAEALHRIELLSSGLNVAGTLIGEAVAGASRGMPSEEAVFPAPSDIIARRIMGRLGECPAYPGKPSECDPAVCDCGLGDDLDALMHAVRTETRALVPAVPARLDAEERMGASKPGAPRVPSEEAVDAALQVWHSETGNAEKHQVAMAHALAAAHAVDVPAVPARLDAETLDTRRAVARVLADHYAKREAREEESPCGLVCACGHLCDGHNMEQAADTLRRHIAAEVVSVLSVPASGEGARA